jgi:hypothetical protein
MTSQLLNGTAGCEGSRTSPTHFLAVQAETLAPTVERIQASLVAHTPALAAALVDAVTAHLTLMVLRLDSEQRLDLAMDALDALPASLQSQGLQGTMRLHARRLSHFRNQACMSVLAT